MCVYVCVCVCVCVGLYSGGLPWRRRGSRVCVLKTLQILFSPLCLKVPRSFVKIQCFYPLKPSSRGWTACVHVRYDRRELTSSASIDCVAASFARRSFSEHRRFSSLSLRFWSSSAICRDRWVKRQISWKINVYCAIFDGIHTCTWMYQLDNVMDDTHTISVCLP